MPSAEIGGVIERLVAGWLAVRAEPDFTLGDFCAQRSDEELVAIALGQPEVHADNQVSVGVSVRIPGPLQRFTGGADELVVEAGTVGAVFESLRARHPDLASAVMPDGVVAGAYLVTVGDDDIRNLDGLSTPVTAGDVVTIVMAMAGG